MRTINRQLLATKNKTIHNQNHKRENVLFESRSLRQYLLQMQILCFVSNVQKRRTSLRFCILQPDSALPEFTFKCRIQPFSQPVLSVATGLLEKSPVPNLSMT
jgi:hypothetical protein